MQTQNQNDVKFGMKACPVRAPVRAEEFRPLCCRNSVASGRLGMSGRYIGEDTS
jgi:hypothetical protein